MIQEAYSGRIERAKKNLHQADFILIGAGAGLSAAAGLDYSGKRFTDNFGPFIEKYGMKDLYSSSFYPFETQEEKWAYWAKHISLNRYDTPVTALYQRLYEFVKVNDHFVITTNVESQFEKAGFDRSRIFEVQGNYANLQCATACHDTLYDNSQLIAKMIAYIQDCRIPSGLVPKCPVCRGDMDVNLRKDGFFVQDKTWHTSKKAYTEFVIRALKGRLVLLELGVGYNTPGIIRFPFESIVHKHPEVTLIRINRDEPAGYNENGNSTIAFDEDMSTVMEDLWSGQHGTFRDGKAGFLTR